MAATEPETLITLAAYERAAAATMQSAAQAYVAGGAGGAGDEITRRDNQRPWERLATRPRMLVGVRRRDPGVELLGRRRPHPVLIAPAAFQHLVHHEGEIATATAAAAAAALPAIADAVGDRIDVLADGGIRRGTDVLKALALGARAVLIGRPVSFGLALGGAEGVQRVIQILLSEFDTAQPLAAAPEAARVDRSFVAAAPWAAHHR